MYYTIYAFCFSIETQPWTVLALAYVFPIVFAEYVLSISYLWNMCSVLKCEYLFCNYSLSFLNIAPWTACVYHVDFHVLQNKWYIYIMWCQQRICWQLNILLLNAYMKTRHLLRKTVHKMYSSCIQQIYTQNMFGNFLNMVLHISRET